MRSEKDVRLALDLGTTTLAGRLLDRHGRPLAEATTANPQGAFGRDVISRLERAIAGEGKGLQALLAEGIEALLAELLSRAGLPRSSIRQAAAAGNPAVCHLLLNRPVRALLFPPHRPVFAGGESFAPPDLPLALPVPLYLFPLISGYVGGDLVAFLFSQSPVKNPSLFLDVGTNGELALFTGERWHVTSVAAGPAFEGGEISCGMTWRPGAVEGVQVAGDTLRLAVVGGGLPRGICGSGLAEAIAAGREGGLIDAAGTIVDPLLVPTNLSRYIAITPQGRALRLYRDAAADLLLTQEDIRNFQLAKGAVRAGAECLLARVGMTPEEIREVVLTGAFGFRLAPDVLKRVAMLPENMIDRVRFVTEGALEGVSRMLTDPEGAKKVQALAAALKPFPLSGTPAFEKAFLNALNF